MAAIRLELSDPTADITRFIQNLELMRVGANEDTPGWLIRRPTVIEASEHFGMLFAESKSAMSEPLRLPQAAEICIGVVEGSIQMDGELRVLQDEQFLVVRPRDGRAVRAMSHPTKIAVFFFHQWRPDPAVANAAAA